MSSGKEKTMSTFDTDEEVRLAVGEIQPNGRFPVTVTFTSGGEHYRSVGDLEAVEGLRTVHCFVAESKFSSFVE